MVSFSPLAGNFTINNFIFQALIICIQINFFGIQDIKQLKNFADSSVQRKLIYVTFDEGPNPKLD